MFHKQHDISTQVLKRVHNLFKNDSQFRVLAHLHQNLVHQFSLQALTYPENNWACLLTGT